MDAGITPTQSVFNHLVNMSKVSSSPIPVVDPNPTTSPSKPTPASGGSMRKCIFVWSVKDRYSTCMPWHRRCDVTHHHDDPCPHHNHCLLIPTHTPSFHCPVLYLITVPQSHDNLDVEGPRVPRRGTSSLIPTRPGH